MNSCGFNHWGEMKCFGEAYDPMDPEMWMLGDSQEICCPPNTHHPHTPATTCTEVCKPCDEVECAMMIDPMSCLPCS